jgi:hypothetical protein
MASKDENVASLKRAGMYTECTEGFDDEFIADLANNQKIGIRSDHIAKLPDSFYSTTLASASWEHVTN